jgi:hypothetical protein
MYQQVPTSPTSREGSLPHHNLRFGPRDTKAQRVVNEIRRRPVIKWLAGGIVGLSLLSLIAHQYNPTAIELDRPLVPNHASARVPFDFQPGLLTPPFPLEKLKDPPIPYVLEYDATAEPLEEPYWSSVNKNITEFTRRGTSSSRSNRTFMSTHKMAP